MFTLRRNMHVDPARCAGTCYRAANWTEAGVTAGCGRARGGGIGYVPHGAPKRVLVCPLRRDARRQLRAAEVHPAWTPWRHKVQLRDSELASLYDKPCRVQDPRGERGKRYALPTVLTIVGAARLAGASTLTGISEFGRAPEPRDTAVHRLPRARRRDPRSGHQHPALHPQEARRSGNRASCRGMDGASDAGRGRRRHGRQDHARPAAAPWIGA